jgi:hypothetical protein
MAVTLKIKTVVDPATLGPVVASAQGSQIVNGLSTAALRVSAPAGHGPVVMPFPTPGAFYLVRNNRVVGPYNELNVAKDQAAWIAQREREFNTDI